MKKIDYVFKFKNVITCLDFKFSQNSKLGNSLQVVTYHFAIDQVESGDFTKDSQNCLSCPYSFNMNGGKSGGCYTHKGLQLMGLKSKLRSLNKKYEKGAINDFTMAGFDKFIKNVNKFLKMVDGEKLNQAVTVPQLEKLFSSVKRGNKIPLVRFGAYGEPTKLPLFVVRSLKAIANNTTGYSHQWHKPENQKYSPYFMASVDSTFEVKISQDLGWKTFFVGGVDDNGINCPASKEAGNKTTCVKCGLCGGASGKSKKSIYIAKH